MRVFEYFKIESFSDDEKSPLSGGRDAEHTPYEMEQLFFNLVKNGDIEGLARLSKAAFKNTDSPVRADTASRNELRQAQYFSVAFLTLGTRYAIEGGMRETDAYSLSDRFVNQIDSEKNPAVIFELCLDAIQEMTHAVYKAAPWQRYSLAIRKCVDYINANLNDKISLDTLAELCGLSPVYLSSLFKKETGINLSQYILTCKLEQAKIMIRAGQHTFEEIAGHLGFCSQSYFIRCFKREYGITPREYKQTGTD